MNEEIKDLIEQLNECSVNDYNFEIYGNEAKILNEYITNLQQENARLRDKLIEIKKVIDGYMPNEHAMCKAFDEIEFILKEN